MLSKLSICLLAKIPCKLLSMLCYWLGPEKIQPESELVVLSESKPLMFLLWEESTKLFTWSLKEPESTHSSLPRQLLNVWLTKSSTLRKTTSNQAMPSRRKNKSKKLPRVIVDSCMTNLTSNTNNRSVI
jgi:hypothetical protein